MSKHGNHGNQTDMTKV